MKIKIRKAKKKDYQEVIKLYADFVKNSNRYKNFDNDSFLKALQLPDFYIYLAEMEKRIVGFITFSIRTVVRYPKPIIEVEEFYVISDLRRKGIGRKLTQKALDFAKKNECQYVFLASGKDRIPAHKFYKSLSFNEYAYHYRRKP